MSNDTSEAKVIIKEMRFIADTRDQWFESCVLLWDEADEDEDEDDVELTLGEGFEESDLSRMILNSPVAALVSSFSYNDFNSRYSIAEVDLSAEERKTLWKLLKFKKVIFPHRSSSIFDHMHYDGSNTPSEFVFDALMSKGRPYSYSRSPDNDIRITEENFAVINSIFKNRARRFSDCDVGYTFMSYFILDYLLLEMNNSLYYCGCGDGCPEEAKKLTIEEMLELLQVPSIQSIFGVFTNSCDELDDDDFEGLLAEFSEKMASEDWEKQYEQYARLYDLRALTSLKKVLEDNREALGIVSELEDVGDKLDERVGFVFKSTGSLEGLDDIFLKISKSMDKWLSVFDFGQKLVQGYDCGEYDTGSLSNEYSTETYAIGVAKELGIEIE